MKLKMILVRQIRIRIIAKEEMTKMMITMSQKGPRVIMRVKMKSWPKCKRRWMMNIRRLKV